MRGHRGVEIIFRRYKLEKNTLTLKFSGKA